MTRHFQRTIEDFTCEKCGAPVTGDGYTNHCPHCLHSKHVDIHPGDRAETCGGLMAPVTVTLKNGAYVLLHRCVRCGFSRPCRTRESEQDAVIALAAHLAATQVRG